MVMSFHCCVPMCTSDGRYDKTISFHRVPSDKKKDLKDAWLLKIRRDVGPYFTISSNTRVCSKHFIESDFKPPDNSNRKLLKEGVIPTVFNWSSQPKQRRKIIRHVDSGTQTDESEDEEGDGHVDLEHPDQNLQPLEDALMELEVSKAETAAANARIQALAAALEAATALIDSAQATANAEKTKVIELKTKLELSRFGLERFSNDDENIKFHTGFPTYKHLYRFYEFAGPCAQHMTYIYSAGINVQDSRPSARNMLLIDELFLFLVRVRLGLLAQDLANRFQIHISSISRKVTTWANYLYFLLGSQSIWPSRQQVSDCMPQGFKNLYPKTRVVIDCTEVYVQTPSSLLLQSQLYSSYKSNTTLKGLLGIAPHGAVTFVSSLYTGCISDKEITRCSGLLELLEPDDSVMADKGFEIEALLNSKGVTLNLPPFLRGSRQFTEEQVHDTKTVAKLRIHVERAIRRIKEFHIFDSDIPLNLLGSINQIYTVICLLTNFQGPLIMSAAT